MLKLPTELPESGRNAALHGWLNELRDAVRSLDPVQGHNQLVHHTAIGIARQGLESEATDETTNGGMKRLRIQNIFANYLETRAFKDEGDIIDPAADAVIVAIPYYLRASSYTDVTLGGFHYKIVNGQIRVSQGGTNADNTSYIVKTFFPTYGIGQDIYALQPQGKTDVIVPRGIVPGTTDVTRLEWIDANVEGRRLETAQIELQLCRLENGVVTQRKVTVEGGPIY